MKNIEREKIKKDYIETYKNSWTYARLTKQEQENIIAILNYTKVFGNSIKDIAYELHIIYSAFLTALNYKPFGWRESEEEQKITNNLF